MNYFLYFVIVTSSFNQNKSDDISLTTDENGHFQKTKNYYDNYLRFSDKFTSINLKNLIQVPMIPLNDMEFQFMFSLKQILIDTFCILRNVFCILGKAEINPRFFYDAITIGQFKSKLDLIVFEFLNSKFILPIYNKKLEQKFTKHAYFLVKNQNNPFDAYNDTRKLFESFKESDIKDLLCILISSIKETEPEESSNDFFGIITFVLIACPVNSYLEYHKILLIHLITLFKMLNIEKRRENSKFRKINLHLIKENIKNIICNWIRPGNLNDTHAQLVEIMSDNVKFKSWFNMFPVVFLMKERNSFNPKVFDSIYKSLNSETEMSVIEIDYFKCMKMMFSIESFLIN